MPDLYVVTATQYRRFNDDTGQWDLKGTPPTAASSRLKYFGSGLMFHCTDDNADDGNGTLRRSLDFGDSWTTLTLPAQVSDYDIDVLGRLWMLGANDDSVYVSWDLGDTWELNITLTPDSLSGEGWSMLKVGSVGDETLIAVTYQVSISQPRLYYSGNSGDSWTQNIAWGGGLNSAIDWSHHGLFSEPDTDRLLVTAYHGAQWQRFDGVTPSGAFVEDSENLRYIASLVQAGQGGPMYAYKDRISGDQRHILRSTDLWVTVESISVPTSVNGLSVGGMVSGPTTNTLYLARGGTVWEGQEASGGDLSDGTLWTALPDVGASISRLCLAIIDEGLFVQVEPDPGDFAIPPAIAFPRGPNGQTLSQVLDKCRQDQEFLDAVQAQADALGLDADAIAEIGQGGIWVDGAPASLISLADRAPVGSYSIVRNGLDYAAAVSTGERGVVWVLGDTENPPLTGDPEVYHSHALRWQPDAAGQPWQVHQAQLEADQVAVGADGRVTIPNCIVAGPQTARAHGKATGGMFVCGQWAWERPAQAAAMIASTRNRLNLDMVLVDVDVALPSGSPVWNQVGSQRKLDTLLAHLQQRFVRSPRAPDQLELSSHTPVFVVLPPSPFSPEGDQLYPNLLLNPESPNNDGAHSISDDSNLFSPLHNDWTSSTTFICPRVTPGTSPNATWQWNKPRRALNFYLGISQGAAVDAGGAVPTGATDVKFNNSPRIWHPHFGIIFRELSTGSFGGPGPTKWWNLDGYPAYGGSYVPVISPDPPPLGIVGEEYGVWTDTRGRGLSDRLAIVENGVTPPPGDSNPDPTFNGPTSGVLSISEAYSIALAVGFTPEQATTFTAIMMGESGLDAGATNEVGNVAGIDRGIAQINSFFHPDVSDACAFDPNCAIRESYRISSNGTNFTPWAQFTTGLYASNLPAVLSQEGTAPPPATDEFGFPQFATPTAAQEKALSITFENWKTGHLADELGRLPIAYLPNYVNVRGWECSDESKVRKSVPSWIKINGKWSIGNLGAEVAAGEYNVKLTPMNGRIMVSGTPCEGDEGVYCLDFSPYRKLGVSESTSFPLSIPVVNKPKMEDAVLATTGVRTPLPDVGERDGSEHFKDASQLHSDFPKVQLPPIATSQHNTAYPSDFCSGITFPLPPKDVVPLVDPCQFESRLCNSPFTGDLTVAADEWCHNNGIGFSLAGICRGGGDPRPDFLAFVNAMAQGLTDFNPAFESADGCQHGLFRVNNCAGAGLGYSRDELLNVAFNAALALPDLGEAFLDTHPRGFACPGGWGDIGTRLQHASIAYLELSRIEPGIHGSPGEVTLGNSTFHDENPCFTVGGIAGDWECYMSTLLAASIPTPGRQGSSGQPGATGPGSGLPGGGTPAQPIGMYVPGCPVTGSAWISADCAWHYAHEGIPAVDYAIGAGAPILSPCDGVIVRRGLDRYANPRNRCIPDFVRGLGVETIIECDNGYHIRLGHQAPWTATNDCCEGTDGLECCNHLVSPGCFPCPDVICSALKKETTLPGLLDCGCMPFIPLGAQCDVDCNCKCPELPGGLVDASCERAFCSTDACDDRVRTSCAGTNPTTGCQARYRRPAGPGESTAPPEAVPCEDYRVLTGDRVGLVDNTGYSFGNHVHVEVWTGADFPFFGLPTGTRICPLEVLPAQCP